MVTVVGVFRSRGDASSAVRELGAAGIPHDRATTLTPETTKQELDAIPTTQGEQPGMMCALGAVVGGAVGAGVVETLVAGLIPGVGPVLAFGMVGGVVLGALTGGAIGNEAEKALFGPLPEEELFFYEQALRQGRTVVIAAAKSDLQASAARGALEKAGAETIDKARHTWWLGLRGVEKEKYLGASGDFDRDERYFRSGFETALRPENRGKSYEEAWQHLKAKYPYVVDRAGLANDAFRHGYERGRAYLQDLFEQEKHAPW